MSEMIWYGPDGRRYRVSLIPEPFDPGMQSIVFRCDGWTGATATAAGYDLLDIPAEQLYRLLRQARRTEHGS